MEYYKISENLKYACLKSKLKRIKTHPNTVDLHKLIKALSTPVSDENLAFLAALSLEGKSENVVLQLGCIDKTAKSKFEVVTPPELCSGQKLAIW